MRALLTASLVLGLATAAMAQTVDLKVGDQAPNFKLQATDGKTLQAVGLQREAGGRGRLVPEGVHARLHDRVQVARGERRQDQDVRRRLLHGERRSDREQHRVRQGDERDARPGREPAGRREEGSRLPDARATRRRKPRQAYGVLNDRGIANRWTFYIDKNGKISYIEKMVKPETSAEDMITKLAELKVPMTHKGTK